MDGKKTYLAIIATCLFEIAQTFCKQYGIELDPEVQTKIRMGLGLFIAYCMKHGQERLGKK